MKLMLQTRESWVIHSRKNMTFTVLACKQTFKINVIQMDAPRALSSACCVIVLHVRQELRLITPFLRNAAGGGRVGEDERVIKEENILLSERA